MAAVLGPDAANQAWSRADRAYAGRGEKRAGVKQFYLRQEGGVGGRKERRKRKKEKGK